MKKCKICGRREDMIQLASLRFLGEDEEGYVCWECWQKHYVFSHKVNRK